MLGYEYDGHELYFTPADHRGVHIVKNTIYHHKVLRINYTTYDMRCAQDSLNPQIPGHGNVMVLSPENEDQNKNPHPYWYAHILGIYHAGIRYTGPNSCVSREPQ